MTTVDAVVIGGGHQGLTTALYLARAGWEVEVVERNDEVGGATRSGQVTEPGLEHDIYATNVNLFLASPVYADLADELAGAGFRPVASDKPFANVFPNHRSLRVYSDQELTERGLEEHHPGDLAGWRRLQALHGPFMQHLMPAYGQRLPSLGAARTLLGAVRRLGPRRVLELGELVACSTRELGERWFVTPEAKALVACWGMHLDFGPDVSFGAMFPFVETFASMDGGIAVTKGGSSALPRALVTLLEAAGGRVRTCSPAVEVRTGEEGRADAVVLADGDVIRARRAVVAGTTPTQLYGSLLSDTAPVPADTRRRARQFAYGPGTMMLHLALDGPVPWAAHDDLRDFAYVHVAPNVDDLARTYQQSLAGQLPDQPLLVVGQTSRVDPSRTPDQREVVWVQVRSVPSVIAGDSARIIEARTWSEAKEAMADRVLANLATHAPGLAGLVRSRAVLSPDDLERENPNLVGGDSLAGSHHLGQNFLFRPWPGASGYRTDVPGLHLVGASTWPGAGVHALSGYLLAQRLLRRRPPWSRAG